jgi:hypothetical protein
MTQIDRCAEPIAIDTLLEEERFPGLGVPVFAGLLVP